MEIITRKIVLPLGIQTVGPFPLTLLAMNLHHFNFKSSLKFCLKLESKHYFGIYFLLLLY